MRWLDLPKAAACHPHVEQGQREDAPLPQWAGSVAMMSFQPRVECVEFAAALRRQICLSPSGQVEQPAPGSPSSSSAPPWRQGPLFSSGVVAEEAMAPEP